MIDTDALETLFQDYAHGFDDFDAEAIADCFTFPMTIWQLGKGHIFADREEILENIEAMLSVLDGEEVVHSSFEILNHAQSGPTALAALSWRWERERGDVALAFICHYLLIPGEHGPTIAMVVNE